MIIYRILKRIGGSAANDGDLTMMMQDLIMNPSIMNNLVPYITGLQQKAIRTKMSWDVDDFFMWAEFEERALNLSLYLTKWNDVVLGNCFTFNHFNNSERMYVLRSDGSQGGFSAAIRINSNESLHWIESAGVMTFIHPNTETIFLESSRYNAQPAWMATIQSTESRYKRLGGRFGRCAKSTSEVNSYYYDGSYTTEGCLRSCYQDEVKKACHCMDSRYPMIVCELSRRKCVESVIIKGDVTQWAKCICPVPCENSQFDTTRSKCNSFNKSERKNANCEDPNSKPDYAIINVQVPRLSMKIFEETPAWTFHRFIGHIGGLGGALCGINCLTFFDFVYLFAIIIPMTLLCNRHL